MKNNNLIRMMALLIFSFISIQAQAFTEIVNREELRLRLGNLRTTRDISELKIAILDNSFAGFIPGKGMLPDSAELIDGPLKYPSTSTHGLGMAQIVWAMTGQSSNGPKMYLVNSNGFTNFKAAVDFVIAKDVDIVLYSQIWLFGSNLDGTGFINAVVNKAIDKGVIWINAAGNLGGHVFSGKITSGTQTFKLKNKLDENSFSLTLAWNNFGESETACSVKDLDLEILDANGTLIQSSELLQQGQAPDPKDPNDRRSCFARESISVRPLERGEYQIRVKAKSANFDSSDTFKVMVTEERPGSLEMTDHSTGFEIMAPADNARVITIGDKSPLSSLGPTADGRIKPDFLIEDSKVSFSNGNQAQGSSNAAAMFAGTLAVMKSVNSNINSSKLLNFAASARQQLMIPAGLLNPVVIPLWIQKYVPVGGLVKVHALTNRAVILSKESPLELPLLKRFNLRMIHSDDLVACDEFLNACGVYPRSQDLYIGPPLIEFRTFMKGAASSLPATWKNIETIVQKL